MSNRTEKLELLRRAEKEIGQKFDIFQTPQWQEVMAHLNDLFGGDPLVMGDPYATHYNIGANAVIDYINRRVDNA